MKARMPRSMSASRPGYSLLEYPLLAVLIVLALAFGLPLVGDHIKGKFESEGQRMGERSISGAQNVKVSRSIQATRTLRGAPEGDAANQIPVGLVEVNKPQSSTQVEATLTAAGSNMGDLTALLGDQLPAIPAAVSQNYVAPGTVNATVPAQGNVVVPVGKILPD